MNSTLENLFKGNLNLAGSPPAKKNPPAPDEAPFVNSLTAEQRKTYEQIQTAIMERCALENQRCFVSGFKLAVRLILEALSNSSSI